MSVVNKKKRCPCDKNFIVELCIEFLDGMLGASRDLTAFLAKFTEDWKAPPKPEVQLPYVFWVQKLAQKCPSLLVAPSVMLRAIMKLDEHYGPVNFTGTPRKKWAAQMGGKLRSLFSRWRRTMIEKDTHRKFVEKLSAIEKNQIEEFRSLMGTAIEDPDGEKVDGENGENVKIMRRMLMVMRGRWRHLAPSCCPKTACMLPLHLCLYLLPKAAMHALSTTSQSSTSSHMIARLET